MTSSARPTEFDEDLFEQICSVIAVGDEIPTLSIKRPNWIAGVEPTGIWVETERSRTRGSGPQFVPAGMITAAWNQLRQNGTLSQDELLKKLNVKRSAFVCALLARFPDVVVHHELSTTLELQPNPADS